MQCHVAARLIADKAIRFPQDFISDNLHFLPTNDRSNVLFIFVSVLYLLVGTRSWFKSAFLAQWDDVFPSFSPRRKLVISSRYWQCLYQWFCWLVRVSLVTEMGARKTSGICLGPFMTRRPTSSCSHWWEFVYTECCHDVIFDLHASSTSLFSLQLGMGFK